ncbi:MAG: DUF3048 domain-containing protein [Parcubacteria group bacterium]|nr:DUF3048 domain-containing protein [Parcubacteria group bacterium]
MKYSKNHIMMSIFGLLVLGIGSFWYFARGESATLSAENIETVSAEHVKNETKQRLIDGIMVEPGRENAKLFSVMIDNHPDARPQYGLHQAFLVVEIPAEAWITRFMAVYDAHSDARKIGPVRSARPYYADMAEELDSAYFHVGGSPDALSRLQNGYYEVEDINQFFQSQYFWRSSKRFAPHNVFTSGDFARTAFEEKNISKVSEFSSWLWKDDSKVFDTRDRVNSVAVDITNAPDFAVEWRYDEAQNAYIRYMGGEKHISMETVGQDETPHDISVKNVVIMFTRMSVVDDEARKDVEMIGSGEAVIVMDGAAVRGEWRKASLAERTRFFVDDEEVTFNRGMSWIMVMDEKLSDLVSIR